MYYHVKIELKIDNYTELSELDKIDRDEVINDAVLPYLQEEDFLFDGRMINKNGILSIKIYETKEKSKTLVDIENNRIKNMGGFIADQKEDVVAYS